MPKELNTKALTWYQVIILTAMALGYFYKFIFVGVSTEVMASQNAQNIVKLQTTADMTTQKLTEIEKSMISYTQKTEDIKEDIGEIKQMVKELKR